MKLKNFVEGLNTLIPYYKGQDGFHIGADHDQFYCHQTDAPLTDSDVKKMRELGWFQPYSDDDEYNAEDGWSAFV